MLSRSATTVFERKSGGSGLMDTLVFSGLMLLAGGQLYSVSFLVLFSSPFSVILL